MKLNDRQFRNDCIFSSLTNDRQVLYNDNVMTKKPDRIIIYAAVVILLLASFLSFGGLTYVLSRFSTVPDSTLILKLSE